MTEPPDISLRAEERAHCEPPNGASQSIPNSCPRLPKVNQYGLISLFDGCSSVHDVIIKAIGYPPVVFIAAENDPDVRRYIAAKNHWNADAEWFVKGESHYRYVQNVDDLVSNNGTILRQAVALAPGAPFIVVAGSPCQDLTVIGRHQGWAMQAGIHSFVSEILLIIHQPKESGIISRNR